eukprot:6186386-Pleurochrysis_carterae.AAC.4
MCVRAFARARVCVCARACTCACALERVRARRLQPLVERARVLGHLATRDVVLRRVELLGAVRRGRQVKYRVVPDDPGTRARGEEEGG